MMKFPARVLAGAVAAVALLAAHSASAQPAPDAHKLELAKRYFAAVHMDKMMDQMLSRMLPAMSEAMAKESGATVDPTLRKEIDEAVLESQRAVMAKLVDEIAPVVADTFTEKELQDLVTFYEGPTAQAMVAKTPELTAKMMPVIMSLLPEMHADVQRRLCARIDCSKQTTAPVSPKT